MKTRLRYVQLRREWMSFLSALGLLSRIPVSWLYQGSFTSEHHHRAQIWYPAAGFVLGLLLAAVTLMLPNQWNLLLQSTVLLVIWVLFSGGLHIDGLADTADAWTGGMGSKQRTLDIMKDPACGPSGVTAIVLCLLLKCVLIAQIINDLEWVILILVPALARAWLLPLLATMNYARMTLEDSSESKCSAGMASSIAENFPTHAGIASFLIMQALALLVLITALAFNGLLILLAVNITSILLFVLIKHSANRRIGGYTGDLLGAFIELQELAVLATVACMISFIAT